MMFLVKNYWHVFVLVSAFSENINLNIIFKIHWIHSALVLLKQKISITFLCAAKIFLINEMSFLMTLIQLTRRFQKWVRMRFCKSYYLVIKVFLKTWIFELLHPQFISLKRVKDLIITFFLRETFLIYFNDRNKNLKIFFASVFYVTYLLWIALRFSFVCV